MTYGQTIRQARRQKGLSQDALAALVGCTPLTILGYEHGRRKPHPSILVTVARALDLDADELRAQARQDLAGRPDGRGQHQEAALVA